MVKLVFVYVMGMGFHFNWNRIRRKTDWSLHVVAKGFDDSDSGDENDRDRKKYAYYSFVRSEFKLTVVPKMNEFKRKWFGENVQDFNDFKREKFIFTFDSTQYFKEFKREEYLSIINSTENMLENFEEIDWTYSVYNLNESNNLDDLKAALFYYRGEIIKFKEETLPATNKFQLTFVHQIIYPHYISKARMGEFFLDKFYLDELYLVRMDEFAFLNKKIRRFLDELDSWEDF